MCSALLPLKPGVRFASWSVSIPRQTEDANCNQKSVVSQFEVGIGDGGADPYPSDDGRRAPSAATTARTTAAPMAR